MLGSTRSFALVLALASAASAAPETPSPSSDRTAPPPRSSEPASAEGGRSKVLEEVSGVVSEIDRKTHRLSIATAKGPVQLFLDRNTMVYTDAGLGTVRDVKPGAQIRVGRNADFLAYWVQVRPPDRPPSATRSEEPPPAAASDSPSR